MTVSTAEFHQDINVPVAPKVLKLASAVLWQPYLGSMWQEDASPGKTSLSVCSGGPLLFTHLSDLLSAFGFPFFP